MDQVMVQDYLITIRQVFIFAEIYILNRFLWFQFWVKIFDSHKHNKEFRRLPTSHTSNFLPI